MEFRRFFLIVLSIAFLTQNAFPQNYFFNLALKKSFSDMAVSTGTKEFFVEKEINCFFNYGKEKEFYKLLENGKLTDYSDLYAYFDFCLSGKVNFCEFCFKDSGLKIHWIDDFPLYKKSFNSKYCVNPDLKVVKSRPFLKVEMVQPIEVSEKTFLLGFNVRKSYFNLQKGKPVGMDLIPEDKRYFFVYLVKVTKNEKVVIMEKHMLKKE